MGQALATATTALAGFALTWLIQSSALLALGLLAGSLVRRSGPAVQSAVYRTTLAAVLISPAAATVLATAGFDALILRLPAPKEEPRRGPVAVVERPSPSTGGTKGEPIVRPEPGGSRFKERSGARTDTSMLATPPPLPLPAHGPVPSTRVLSRSAALPVGLAVWLLGAILLVLRLLVGQRRMDRLRAGAVPAEADAEALCRDLAGQMRLGSPAVLRSPFLFSPCLDGLRRPAILLPEDVRDHLRETFIHELAHLARRDGLWNLVRRSATAALWVQPLLWVLSRRLEVTAEEVCDDFVVHHGADRARYAGYLLELAGRALPPAAPAGVGMISIRTLLGRRIVRILDPTRSLSIRAGSRAVLVVLVAGLAVTMLASLLGVGEGKRQAQAQTATKTADAPKRIVNPPSRSTDMPPARTEPTDVPITGRIIDLEGRPVAGVKVKVESLQIPKPAGLTPWLEGIRNGQAPWIAASHLEANRPETRAIRPETTTDQEGRFRLEGLGGDRVVGLSLQGDTIAYTSIDLVTRRIAPIPARGYPYQYGPGIQTIYGADFTYTAAPGRPVNGVVKDARTDRPLADVEVRSQTFAGSDWGGMAALKTRTDAQGRFVLMGMPKGKGNRLLLVPNDDEPYFLHEFTLPDPPGMAALAVEIGLSRGIWIEGRITEQATGKPVAKARLFYIPFLRNTFAQATAGFDKDGNVEGTSFQDRYLSKDDGTFRLVSLPGPAIVGAAVHEKRYVQGTGSESIAGMNKSGQFETYRNPFNPGKIWPTVMKEIDPVVDAEVVRVELQVVNGPTVRLRVVDTEGNPVVDVKTRGLGGRGSYEREEWTTPEVEVTNLMPGEERTVLISQNDRKLGKVVRVRKGDDAKGPVVVALEPLAAITGRVADADGNPVAGAMVRPNVLPSEDFSISLSQVVTDKDGHYRVPDVPVGCEYSLVIEGVGPFRDRKYAFTDKNLTVNAGETTDIGEIRFKSD